MKTISKVLAKGATGAVAAGAMAMVSATPAAASDRHRDRDGISAGEVIAGAVILGGIAAVAASVGKDRDRGYYRDDYRYRDGYRYRDRDYRGARYQRRGNGRRAVERCIRAVESDARRAGYRFADVTEIRDVDRERYGWEVKGRLVVDGSRGYGRYNARYDRYDRYDRRGRYDRGYNSDSGRFTCDVSRGRVVDIDYRGIRGLR